MPTIDRLLALVESTERPDMREPIFATYRSLVLEPKGWSPALLERRLSVTLPQPLLELWRSASSLRLFEDMTFGQWGLVILPPEESLEATLLHRQASTGAMAEGDLVIGEFLGDADVLLVRCEKGAEDFGSVLVKLPLDPRKSWPIVGASLDEFLEQYLHAKGDLWWSR